MSHCNCESCSSARLGPQTYYKKCGQCERFTYMPSDTGICPLCGTDQADLVIETPRTVEIRAICKALEEHPTAYNELRRLVSMSEEDAIDDANEHIMTFRQVIGELKEWAR